MSRERENCQTCLTLKISFITKTHDCERRKQKEECDLVLVVKRRWTVNGKQIFSDKPQVVINPNIRLHIWRSVHEAYRPECMYTECKPKISDMGVYNLAMFMYLCKVDGNINAVKYIEILDNQLWQLLPITIPTTHTYSRMAMQLFIGPVLWRNINMNFTKSCWGNNKS